MLKKLGDWIRGINEKTRNPFGKLCFICERYGNLRHIEGMYVENGEWHIYAHDECLKEIIENPEKFNEEKVRWANSVMREIYYDKKPYNDIKKYEGLI